MGSPTDSNPTFSRETGGDHGSTQDVPSIAGPQIEKLNYGVSCVELDYGTITARNQLIKNVINPLMDMIDAYLKPDHIVDSKTKYKVALVVTSTREIDTVQ
jgi:hypothetical protein